MRIVLLQDLPDWRSHLAAVEQIFFTSSAVQKFPDEARRERFKVRWLGRYLDHFLESFFVALARDPKKWAPVFAQDHAQNEKLVPGADNAKDGVLGYLAGCLEDPQKNPRFADLGYYQAFGPLCESYPAHLHINVVAEVRSLGVGAALIEAFAAQVSQHRMPGLHLVTNEGARNVRFYERNGFRLLATTSWNDAPVVFMGRRTS
jgi:GNAT superfamily N-acetyltransferase